MNKKYQVAQDLYIILSRPLTVKAFVSFKMVVGGESAELAVVYDLVAKERVISIS